MELQILRCLFHVITSQSSTPELMIVNAPPPATCELQLVYFDNPSIIIDRGEFNSAC